VSKLSTVLVGKSSGRSENMIGGNISLKYQWGIVMVVNIVIEFRE
jgi:hypothetical protein